MDKFQKTSNDLHQDLEEEIKELNEKINLLQAYQDDVNENIQKERKQMEKEVAERLVSRENDIKIATEDKNKLKAELDSLKQQVKMKRNELAIMQ